MTTVETITRVAIIIRVGTVAREKPDFVIFHDRRCIKNLVALGEDDGRRRPQQPEYPQYEDDSESDDEGVEQYYPTSQYTDEPDGGGTHITRASKKEHKDYTLFLRLY